MPSGSGIERRTRLRNVSLNGIHFCFEQDPPGTTRMGATVNISDAGMCVVTSSNLREGECLIIKNELSILSRKATVQWVRNYQQNFCKAGLMFTE